MECWSTALCPNGTPPPRVRCCCSGTRLVNRAQVFYLAVQTLQNSESAEIMGETQCSFGRPFRAHLRLLSYPGLKPWAILYNRFAVKSESA
jgi:hypothetical protein